MTDEERFRFDLAGFFVRPSILSTDDIAAITEQIDRIHHDPQSLPQEQRRVPGGASAVLIDHLKVIDVLDELVLAPRNEHAPPQRAVRGDRLAVASRSSVLSRGMAERVLRVALPSRHGRTLPRLGIRTTSPTAYAARVRHFKRDAATR